MQVPEMPDDRKKSKQDKQTLTDLSSAHRRLQVLCQLTKKRIYFFLAMLTINILLTTLSWSVWKNPDRGR